MPELAVSADSKPTLYQRIGEDAAIRRLVDRFYDLMDSDPGAARLRALDDCGVSAELQGPIRQALSHMTDDMVNR